MPPHTRTVLRYHSGKLPLFQASAKLSQPERPGGVSEAMSSAPARRGRSDATAIQANGTAQTSAAAQRPQVAPAAAPHALIMDAAFESAERDHRQREQRRDADHGRRRGEAGVVVLLRLLVDVIEQQIGGVGRAALRSSSRHGRSGSARSAARSARTNPRVGPSSGSMMRAEPPPRAGAVDRRRVEQVLRARRPARRGRTACNSRCSSTP